MQFVKSNYVNWIMNLLLSFHRVDEITNRVVVN